MNPANRTKKRLTPTKTDAHPWPAEEFERLVFECKPKVAVFDCDGTLWSGDAGYGFMAWSLEQGLVSRSTNDWVDTRYRAYTAGDVSEADMCGEMVQMYAGLRDSELRAAAARYVGEFVRERVFAEMAALVEKMRQAGIEIWAVSSTNRWVVAEGLRDFGITGEHILAAEVRVKDGIITSEIIDVPTDEAKAAALKRVGLAAARCRVWQLDSRPGDAGDGALSLSCESVSGAQGSVREERLGLLHAAGGRGH